MDRDIPNVDLEPYWKPLESVVPTDRLADFMHMCRVGTIQLYKHRGTRRYINIDAITGVCSQYSGGEYKFVERNCAIMYVLDGRTV